ncbi:MAG: hypothetical protein ACM3S1_08585 [Hyphomicrobiales bacterium]
MDEELRGRLRRLLGRDVRPLHATTGGYTHAFREIIELGGGERAFVKAATDDTTAEWLRTEHRMYADVAGPFMARVLAFDDGPRPVLVLEDLSRAHWPPPWEPGMAERVMAALRLVAETDPPAWLPSLESQRDRLGGWATVADDPAPFLALGLCSAQWLDESLPSLLAAEAAAVLDGDALVHLDVRSDNLCFDGERTLLVDWNLPARGNAAFDVAFWLPSLEAEGGPPPEAILPGEPELAAMVAGFFAARAGLPVIPHAPRVREVQLQQLRTALPWAARALGLPPPGGSLAGPPAV